MCVFTACKMIVDEVQYAIKKEDPKKMIEVRVHTVCTYLCMYSVTVCLSVCLSVGTWQ